jgi:hypothetical protein
MQSWSFRGNSMQDRLGRLHLALNGNPFAALGPPDTRAGRIIRHSCLAPARRSAAAIECTVLAPLEPTHVARFFAGTNFRFLDLSNS